MITRVESSHGFKMNSVNRNPLSFRRQLFFILFFAYFVISVLGMFSAEKKEYFPVFSWSLFTFVPELSTNYEIEITAIDGKSYDPPVDFFDLKDIFIWARRRDTSILKTAGFYHWAKINDPSHLAALRAVIENRYLAGPRQVDYRIVLVQHNPLQRWRTGEIIDKITIADLSKGEQQ